MVGRRGTATRSGGAQFYRTVRRPGRHDGGVLGRRRGRLLIGGVVGRAYAGGGSERPGQIWIGRVLWPAASTRRGLRRQGHMHASHLYYAVGVSLFSYV